ncbi:MAG: FtsX-like permease family protein [Bacteroidales bacterium]|nr:FtsX-like permease family protein [Bacteroidales bacterium]MCF8387372.1 FtsX-like permease family protein [Bacteroidales bacterium]MCF8397850.1 FtsX-like permease family protein [Bacteroidales bacterium]
MNFPFYIAKRYLISKKSHNIINIISGISVSGITLGTMALIIILSVFNGFENLVISLFNTFNPDLKIEIKEGKTFTTDQLPADEIKSLPGVVSFTEVVEDNALVQYDDKQHIVTIKGLGDNFNSAALDSMMIDGRFQLKSKGRNFAVLGAGVAYFLGVNITDFSSPLSIYVPSRTRSPSLSFENAFNEKNIMPAGVFSIQQDFDTRYILVPIDFARELMEYSNQLSSIEIGTKAGADIKSIQSRVEELAGNEFRVQNRFQQQELLYKIMRSEKWVSFLILTFILIIATFNLIGSLSMLILDKKKDIAVLHSMGANNKLIRKIFLVEGMMISLLGGILGLLLGGVITWLQMEFGLLRLGSGEGSFVVDYYPVDMQFMDFVYIFLTVALIGLISAWMPVRQISRKYFMQKLG